MMSATQILNYRYQICHRQRGTGKLNRSINIGGLVWNHAVALQRRYYRLTGKYIGFYDMCSHFKNLRNRGPVLQAGRAHFPIWSDIAAHSVNRILMRLDNAYKRLFERQGGRPRFCRVRDQTSLPFTPGKFIKLLEITKPGYRRFRVSFGKTRQVFEFHYHRPFVGKLKTITIKRDAVGTLWLVCCVETKAPTIAYPKTGREVGLDFGLRHFLTTSDGQRIEHPRFFEHAQKHRAKLQRQLARKVRGSRNYNVIKRQLACLNRKTARQREDFHWKLAHTLCYRYDLIKVEDLTMRGMQKQHGRKINDYGFAGFVRKLAWVARKSDVKFEKVDRWFPSSQLCSCCGARQKIGREVEVYNCKQCGLSIDRDHNAAINILRAGVGPVQEECKPVGGHKPRQPLLC